MTCRIRLSILLRCHLLILFVSVVSGGIFTAERPPLIEEFSEDYGVDVTAPIHHYLDDRSYFGKRYDKMIGGCFSKFSKRECKANEDARIHMNLDQPSHQHNYTEIGFKKLKAPRAAWEPLLKFYEDNKDRGAHPEKWPRGNTYTNNWESPTHMISLEDQTLRGGNGYVKKLIWDGVKPIIEEWVGTKIEPTSLYGIRVYKENAVLATHVDRLPLVSSCIIQVAQDVDDPWPIEVYAHDGKAYNVTMEPGDMVLYESHTVLHGRPFPLQGRHYANVFVHFQPVGHDERSALVAKSLGKKAKKKTNKPKQDRKMAGHEQDNHANHLETDDAERTDVVGGVTAAHRAAAVGNVEELEKIYHNTNIDAMNSQDSNGWSPIHEAARSGHLEALRFLVEAGADIGAKTNAGSTALWWAKRSLPRGHSAIAFLVDIGAPEEGEM